MQLQPQQSVGRCPTPEAMVNGATARLNMTAPTFKEVKAIMGKPIEEPPEKQPLFETPDGVTQARQHLMKAANLYNLCVACVDKVIAPKVPPVAQTSEFFQAAVATLFINASHMRFIEKMPPHPLKQ